MGYRNQVNSLDTFRELYREIKQGKLNKPIYYFHGDEIFLIDLIQDEVEKILPPGQKDFNFDLLYAGETVPAAVLNIAGSYPMMAEKRIVIVRDFMRFDELGEGSKTIEFLEYLKRPNPSTILCLIDQKFPDKRGKLGKLLSDKKESAKFGVYEFPSVPEQKLPDWVADWTEHRHKMKISPMAAQLLAHLAGPDLKIVSTEIEKLCTFVDSSEVINEDHVKKITESYREYNIVELKNAVMERDLDKSLMIAEQMLLKSNNSTGELFKTVGFFYSVFGNIWQICRLTEKGLNKSQIQEAVGEKRSYVFNLMYNDASGYRLNEMPNIFEALLDADRALKGFSTLDTPTIFLLLIKRIVG